MNTLPCGCPPWTGGYTDSDVVTYRIAAGLRTDDLGIPAAAIPSDGWITISGTVLDITPLTHSVRIATWGSTAYVGGHGSDDVFVAWKGGK